MDTAMRLNKEELLVGGIMMECKNTMADTDFKELNSKDDPIPWVKKLSDTELDDHLVAEYGADILD